MVKVYEQMPIGFNAQVEVAACYIEIDGKLLLLQRASGKREAETWGVPAGKLETNEMPQQAALRELHEETGILIESDAMVTSYSTLYMSKPDVHYAYHMFKITLKDVPPVTISLAEHKDYAWVAYEQIKNMPLIAGAYEALLYYRQRA